MKLKFRIWEKNTKCMNYLRGIEFFDDMIGLRFSHFGVDTDTLDDIEIMQFTGLYDKNGREIYEGDIVHLSSKDGIDYNAVIQFIDGGFCATDGIEDYACKRYCLSYFDLDVEVVGNIYENPELLERIIADYES